MLSDSINEEWDEVESIQRGEKILITDEKEREEERQKEPLHKGLLSW